MTYICAQDESAGLLCLPALVVSVAEPLILQTIQGLPERAAADLRLQRKWALCLHDPHTFRVNLAVALGGLYELEIDVAVRVSAHTLPLFGHPTVLQVRDAGV